MNVNTKAGVEEYDLVILGRGTGGTVAAGTFAAQGQHVAVIERR
jgi:pyruvate/2-oxoglutarate dehydrogenase complex dihydrolipoamide dehydrogenase (E3) component